MPNPRLFWLLNMICMGVMSASLACEQAPCPEEPIPPSPPPSAALEAEVQTDMPFDMGIYMLMGWQRPDFNALIQRLSSQGFQGYSQDLFAVGGGLNLGFGSLLTEMQGWVNLSLPVVNTEYITWSYASTGLLNLGYLFRPARGIRLYPVLGIGMGILDLQFSQRNPVLDFDSFLKNPGRQGRLSSLMLVLHAGLGIDAQWPMLDNWGLRMGLRGGWLWTPVPSSFWQVDNLFVDDGNSGTILIPGGPAVGMTGPYLHLSFGF